MPSGHDITRATHNKIVRMRKRGAKYREIAEKLGLSAKTVSEHCKQAGLTPPSKGGVQQTYMPTPEEIDAVCKRLKARWNEMEFKQRRRDFQC